VHIGDSNILKDCSLLRWVRYDLVEREFPISFHFASSCIENYTMQIINFAMLQQNSSLLAVNCTWFSVIYYLLLSSKSVSVIGLNDCLYSCTVWLRLRYLNLIWKNSVQLCVYVLILLNK
jgi:hypothetical protein